MELLDAVRGRRSISRLTAPAPSDGELVDLISDAAGAPDHGLLRPWRLITLRDEARSRLGAAFAADLPDDDEESRQRAAGKPLRAPLLLSIVLTPRENPKVPEWEQVAAVATMVHNLSLLLHDRGWGAIWRTGAPARSPNVRAVLGLEPAEQLLGWLYVGTPDPGKLPPPRPRFEPRERLHTLRPSGEVAPIFPGSRKS